MKNFKKISVVLFAITSLTEMSHPIFLTGPARRNAHRSQREEAYKAGLMESQRQEDFQDQYESEDDRFNENYADDGSVAIQAIGSGEFGGQIASQLTPEAKMRIMERLRNRDEVQTQSIRRERVRNPREVEVQSIETDIKEEEIIDPEFDTASIITEETELPAEALQSAENVSINENSHDNEALEPVIIPTEQTVSVEIPESALAPAPESAVLSEPIAAEEAISFESIPAPVENYAINSEATIPLVEEVVSPESTINQTQAIEIEPIVETVATEENVVLEPTVRPLEIETVAIKPTENIIIESPTENAVEPVVESAIEEPVAEQKELEITASALEPAAIETPASENNENVKIVKVYPVYEAARSAIHSVKIAAQDMIHYLYNFFAKKEIREEEEEDIKIQFIRRGPKPKQ